MIQLCGEERADIKKPRRGEDQVAEETEGLEDLQAAWVECLDERKGSGEATAS